MPLVGAAKHDVLAKAAITGSAVKNKMRVNGEKMQALHRSEEKWNSETKCHFSDLFSQ